MTGSPIAGSLDEAILRSAVIGLSTHTAAGIFIEGSRGVVTVTSSARRT